MHKIQLNILDIESWSQVFACYHTDLVCIGYDINKNDYVCLEERWKRFLNNYLNNNPIFISNFLNIHNKQILKIAMDKYIYRGFLMQTININKLCDTFCLSDNDNSIYNSISPLFCLDYILKNINDEFFAISYNIENLLDNTNTIIPSIMHLYSIKDNHIEFIELPSLLNFTVNCKECNILCNNQDIFLENIYCSHHISLRVYLLSNIHLRLIKKCPFCREITNYRLI